MNKQYIIQTVSGNHYLISETVKQNILSADTKGSKMIELPNGSVIMLNGISSIDAYDKAKYMYSERLKLHNKTLCKTCGKVIGVGDRCECFDDIKSVDVTNAFADLQKLGAAYDLFSSTQKLQFDEVYKPLLKEAEKK